MGLLDEALKVDFKNSWDLPELCWESVVLLWPNTKRMPDLSWPELGVGAAGPGYGNSLLQRGQNQDRKPWLMA